MSIVPAMPPTWPPLLFPIRARSITHRSPLFLACSMGRECLDPASFPTLRSLENSGRRLGALAPLGADSPGTREPRNGEGKGRTPTRGPGNSPDAVQPCLPRPMVPSPPYMGWRAMGKMMIQLIGRAHLTPEERPVGGNAKDAAKATQRRVGPDNLRRRASQVAAFDSAPHRSRARECMQNAHLSRGPGALASSRNDRG